MLRILNVILKGVYNQEKWPKMIAMLKSALEAAKDIFFPRLCFSCGKKTATGSLCSGCKAKIKFLSPPLCPGCSAPAKDKKGGRCKKCLKKIFPYEKTVSITAYEEPVISLIRHFKYNRHCHLAEEITSLIIERLAALGLNPRRYDLLCPVPMHDLKIKVRGYNHAALLGKNLANHFKIPFRDDIIYAWAERPSQAKLKKAEREDNLKGAFAVKEDLAGKKILLIDDVFTTGATARECAYSLKNNRSGEVTVLTFARTR